MKTNTDKQQQRTIEEIVIQAASNEISQIRERVIKDIKRLRQIHAAALCKRENQMMASSSLLKEFEIHSKTIMPVVTSKLMENPERYQLRDGEEVSR